MTDFELLEKVAQKAIEPFNEDVDRNKTIGQWRAEMTAVLMQVISHVANRNGAP